MKRIFLSPPQIFLAVLAALFVFWLVYVGVALWPRLHLPPVDTSAPFLLTSSGETYLVENKPDGTENVVKKAIGPITPWQDGIVYWDVKKSGLFMIRPGQKVQAVRLKPHQNMNPTSLVPAKDGVFINSYTSSSTGFKVVLVHLPDGASKIMPKMTEVRGSQNNAAIAYQEKNYSFVVRYPGGGTRTLPSVIPNQDAAAWDYDPARDAFVCLINGEVVYQSKAHTWRKNVGYNYDAPHFGGADGAVWLHKGGRSASEIWVIDAAGRERGPRWRSRDKDYYATGDAMEITPAQADLVRAVR